MSTTLGNYQNNITSLSSLDTTSYERIFKVFETKDNNKNFYYYNILKKIELPSTIDDEYISFYTVNSNLPMTILSYKIYGDMKLWWLIYLLNKEELGTNIFVVPGGTQLQYIKPEIIPTVLQQITDIIIYNGRHY